MKPAPTDIVFSAAGHDKGEAFIVLEADAQRVHLVNGKTRKLDKPKIKSLKHIRFGGEGNPELNGALRDGLATNRRIRKELAIFRSSTNLGRE